MCEQHENFTRPMLIASMQVMVGFDECSEDADIAVPQLKLFAHTHITAGQFRELLVASKAVRVGPSAADNLWLAAVTAGRMRRRTSGSATTLSRRARRCSECGRVMHVRAYGCGSHCPPT